MRSRRFVCQSNVSRYVLIGVPALPREIEAKMKLAGAARAELDARLASHGASRGARLLEINRFFDTPEHALRTRDAGLRIRVERDLDTGRERTVITHKGARAAGSLKSREETELEVASAADADALLRALGFVEVLRFEKLRQRWVLGPCRVELDRLPLLGDFVEVEGSDERAVLDARARLGLEGLPLLTNSYAALLADAVAALPEAERALALRLPESARA
jgi:predicted adenylyl cyclase CyaB